MKKNLLLIFILFFFLNCNKHKKQNSITSLNDSSSFIKKDSLDKELKKLNTNKYDTIIRNKTLNIAYLYGLNQNLKKYYITSKIVEKKSTINQDTLGVILANMNIGYYFSSKFNNDSAYFYYTKAQKLSLKINSKPLLETIIQRKSDILWSQNNFAEAEKEAIKAVKIAVKKNNYESMYDCYVTIANSLVGMKNESKALQYYNKALKITDKINSTTLYGGYKWQIYIYIALIYQKQNEHQKVINYINEKTDLYDIKKKDIKIYSYLSNTLSFSKFKLGDKTTVNQFNETLKIGDSLKFAPIQVTSKTYLGEYYLAQKDSAKANFYLKDAQILAHQNNIFEDELAILKLLKLANPKKANFYSDRFISLTDSLQDVERATLNKFARIEFETDEVNQQKEIVELQNSKLKLRIWLIAGFALFTVFIITLLFKNKSQKAKTKELLLEQENLKDKEEIYQLMISQQQQFQEGKNIEKERISQELHDGVMGRLAAVRLNMFALLTNAKLIKDEKFSLQITEIQEVEKEIRTIAHDLSNTMFSKSINFSQTIQLLFDKIKNHSQIVFKQEIYNDIEWEKLNQNLKINLYRIIQEAIQNIEKYANANNVTIVLKQINNNLQLTIIDDGKGFDISTTKKGIGIKNMTDRALKLNGEINITSKNNEGTTISLIIPI